MSYLKSRVPPAARDKVVFAGLIPRPELIENYYAADVFAFPPIWNEGFGLPPLEAMAAGAPVVASRSGATTETIKDKETGYLVEKNDPRALASAILTLLENDDLAQRMGRAGRQRAMEHFTWDRVAEGMYKRYQGLCGMNAQPESVLTPSFQR